MAFEKVASCYDVPKEVMTAAASVDVSGLPTSFFADPSHKRFPCFSKEATLMSLAEYEDTQSSIPESAKDAICENLLKAADVYGIKSTLAKTASAKFSVQCSDEEYKIDMTTDDTEDGIQKMACELLNNVRPTVSYDLGKQAAEQIIKHCADNDLYISDDTTERLYKLAGYGCGSKKLMCEELLKRAYCDGAPKDLKAKMKDAYKHVKDTDDSVIETPEMTSKVASLLDYFDQGADRRKKYITGYKVPEEAIFTDTPSEIHKMASDVFSIPSIDSWVSKKDLVDNETGIRTFFDNIGTPVHGITTTDGLLAKVASLDAETASLLLDSLDAE